MRLVLGCPMSSVEIPWRTMCDHAMTLPIKRMDAHRRGESFSDNPTEILTQPDPV